MATALGFAAFFALYAATRSALTRSASASSSSSEPKRSTSSSSSSSALAAGADAPPRKASPAELEPEREANSASYDLMWVYQRATAGVAFASGAAVIALKTATSACEGVYL